MTTPISRKRQRPDSIEAQGQVNDAGETSASRKRRRPSSSASETNADDVEDTDHERHRYRLRSEYIEVAPPQIEDEPEITPSKCRPPSGYELDRLNEHLDLQAFGKGLQNAVNAVFSGDRRSRYTHVSALLLSWEDEDPQLPVSWEIRDLKGVFVDLYGFEVEEWRIPALNSHMELNLRVLNFLKDSTSKHLKIVYYAGHGKLSNHGQSLWTSHRNNSQDRCPTVKWSGIQNALEESQSDILVLLDCCASGLSNTDEGNGVTELLAACAFNSIANGVGPFSFTHALISQLRKLAHVPSFTVGYLYNLLFTEIQGWRLEDSKHKKAPVHLVLTQDRRLPRSITLSAKDLTIQSRSPGVATSLGSHGFNGQETGAALQGISSSSSSSSDGAISPFGNYAASSTTSATSLPEYPRLLFSIRISEDIKPKDLSTELFADWLGTVPIAAKSIQVEAGFASDSTLLMVSMPVALLGYLPKNPAITMLGTTRSTNLLAVDSVTLQQRCATLQYKLSRLETAHTTLQGEYSRLINGDKLLKRYADHSPRKFATLSEKSQSIPFQPSPTPRIKKEVTWSDTADAPNPGFASFAPDTSFAPAFSSKSHQKSVGKGMPSPDLQGVGTPVIMSDEDISLF